MVNFPCNSLYFESCKPQKFGQNSPPRTYAFDRIVTGTCQLDLYGSNHGDTRGWTTKTVRCRIVSWIQVRYFYRWKISIISMYRKFRCDISTPKGLKHRATPDNKSYTWYNTPHHRTRYHVYEYRLYVQEIPQISQIAIPSNRRVAVFLKALRTGLPQNSSG